MTSNHTLHQNIKALEKEIKSLPQGGWYDDYKVTLQAQVAECKAQLQAKEAQYKG